MKRKRFPGSLLGGAALALGLGTFAAPSVAQDTGNMRGMHADTSHQMRGMDHGTMDMQPTDSMDMGRMMEMYTRMMKNPAMRERVMADTAMHRKMMEMVDHMPAEQREQMMRMMREADTAKPNAGPARSGHQGHTPSMKP